LKISTNTNTLQRVTGGRTNRQLDNMI